jgi:hypothetical protein
MKAWAASVGEGHGGHRPLMICFKALLALTAHDAAAPKVRFRRGASRAPIPPSNVHHCRRLGPSELCADRLLFLAEPSCSGLIFKFLSHFQKQKEPAASAAQILVRGEI